MTKIYLIRHAEAEGNLYRRIQGHYDGDITIKGYKQIDHLAERFCDVDIDAVYASDLRRTQKTAGAVLKNRKLTLNIDSRLKEVDMGAWEDKPWGNVAYDEPEQMLSFANDPNKWTVEGCERFDDLRNRMLGVITELAQKHQGQTIACVSHGMAIRTLISALKDVPSERICEIPHGDNTCVASISYVDGKLELEYFNDNSHLPHEASTFAGQEWWKEKIKVDYSNLRILPMDITADAQLYTRSYRDAWESAHGTQSGFNEDTYLNAAISASNKNPLSLMKAYYGDDYAGIIELDTNRMSATGAGWISLCYLIPDMRGQGMGVQLVGHAVSVYRRLGRKALRLHVSHDNKRALAFYEKLGFQCIATESGSVSPLYLMEKSI